MSLLNKISGFAQKAKENVVSKSVISKDRRLEQSLSETIKVNEIYFEKMSTYGLPSVINVIAFDCVSGLLAIGISTLIKLPTPTGIKHLQFKSGFPILVVIDKVNRIMTIDLRTKSIRHTLQAKAIITCQTYCTGTDWLFIGYSNGCVDVFDIMQGIISPYQIPDLLLEIQNEEEQQDSSHIVVDLQMHPSDLNTLLIGYESHIFLWNIRENIIQRSFTLRKLEKSSPYRNANLTCFAWSPNGSRFIAGYDDGCTHLWDIKNENKPIISRKLSKAFFSELSTSEDQVSSEPIYQIAWYTNETVQKSYILIAGGIPPAVIQGLHILEFNLGNETKEASKQSIMPLPVDLSHFLILSSNPYYLGMHNPFGIAIIGIDHCLRTYSLDYGFPLLKLPPALEFINPKILSACHIPQLPINSFKKLTSWTHNEKMTRYLPITGGVTGPEHVYHIESNDLLITIHQGEIVKFWDASYTALRPLSYLTIACLEDIDDRNTILYCLDINKKNGTLLIGFSDGSILVYEYQENLKSQTQVDSRLQSRNEEFINSCDDTLKEISELLEDMETTEADVEEHLHEDKSNTNTFVHSSSLKEQTNLDTTNPFLNSPPTQQHQTVSSEHQTLSADSIQPHSGLPIFKKINKQHDEKTGFFATLKITLCSPIKSVIHLGEFIIAAATDDGQIYVIDIDKQLILFSHNITRKLFVKIKFNGFNFIK
ncbi:WD40-repeat-containing domain protein [Cokeromyces recurvatus]|uniref:WD40-repeat-containing domain protein n=1 Tax=Cokeromyces recurvatus TaxID=90255 RepID=UPI00221F41FF|nr:WD40-repeat-containing domain protein [Cokeromyces recurvatus]KAI7897519.1 WD40-repeat-containing domain protein [Cokeromyces recurvatus]